MTTVNLESSNPIHLFAAMFMGVENGDTNSHPVARANLLDCVERRDELKNKKFTDLLASDTSLEDAFKKLLTDAGKSAEYAYATVIAMKFTDRRAGDTIDDNDVLNKLEGENPKFGDIWNGGLGEPPADDAKVNALSQILRDGLRAYAKHVLGKKLQESTHETLRTLKDLGGVDLPEWAAYYKNRSSETNNDQPNSGSELAAQALLRQDTGVDSKKKLSSVLKQEAESASGESGGNQPDETRKFVRYTHAPISQETVDGLATLSAQAGEHASRREREKAQSERRLEVLLAVVREQAWTNASLKKFRDIMLYGSHDGKKLDRGLFAKAIFKLAPRELREEAGWTTKETIAADLSDEHGFLALEGDDLTRLSRELERLIRAGSTS